MTRRHGDSGPGEVPDEEVLRLVRRAREGDPGAFGALLAHFEGQALSIGIRVLQDREAARDVVQDAFLSAFRYLGSYRPGRPFRAWLMRIVLNEALDHRRARSRAPWDDTAAAPDDRQGAADQEQGMIDAQARRAVEALLGELTTRERAAFVLRDVEGWPTAEVAEALGCRPVTVRRHVSLARQRLQDLLRARHPELVPGSAKDRRTP